MGTAIERDQDFVSVDGTEALAMRKHRNLALAALMALLGGSFLWAQDAPQDQARATGGPDMRQTTWSPFSQPPPANAACAAVAPIDGRLPATNTKLDDLPASPSVSGHDAGAAAVNQSFWTRCAAHLQDCFIGYPSEFQAPPLGYYVYYYGRTQVANGDASRMVLYHYDFEPGSDRLNLRGKRQLAKIIDLLPKTFSAVVIETTPEQPLLDEARRTVIVNGVLAAGFPLPPERVVAGFPLAMATSGREAEIIYTNFLRNAPQAGPFQGLSGSQAATPGGPGGAPGGPGGAPGSQGGASATAVGGGSVAPGPLTYP
jgi:hypothetical protein